jgi:hypothetical protein
MDWNVSRIQEHAALKREQTQIEGNLGVELEWKRLPQKQACRIKRPEGIDGTTTGLTADQ